MSGRNPDEFTLKPKDRLLLHQLLRDGQTPLRVARRAQILLNRAHNQQSVRALGVLVAQSPSTLWRVCERYREQGLQAALYDASRSGRPHVFFRTRTPAD